ncbi:tyrosine-type recombinase/integrase [Tepidimonas sp.]|uniref:tyrosine-type recombinase/integrase n=1 Tax=Tepidimonas sp. TaxID=2002775 RepID=UPI00391B4F05
MASFRKVGKGWRAEVARRGVRQSKVFPTKAQAAAWAAQVEASILAGNLKPGSTVTVAQAVERYLREIVPRRRGGNYEKRRLLALLRLCPWLADMPVAEIRREHMARWRDERRAAVSDASVVRESSDLRTLWKHCRAWGLMDTDPFKELPMPNEGHARARRTDWRELRLMLRGLGYVTGRKPSQLQHEVAWMYLVAHHTAVRAGEIHSLSTRNVDLERRVIRLDVHKTMEHSGIRHVPFTRKAARLLALLDKWAKEDGREPYFTINPQSRDALFRKIRDRLLIDDLHFHDARADALTRLSRRVDVMTLARISGHRDLRQLLNTYYRETAEQIAARL